MTSAASNIGGELQSSKYIDGNFGEYDLTRGHFFCFDPYPSDKKSVKEQHDKIMTELETNFA